MKYQNQNINTFTTLLKQYKYKLNKADIVAGLIKYKEFKGFLIDIGSNICSYLPQEELQLNMDLKTDFLKEYVYTTREFFLIKYNVNNKKSIVSIKRLEYIRAWKRIQQLCLENIVFNLKIHTINKGGVVTYLEGIKAFIPNSHQYISGTQDASKNITCKLLIANEYKNEIILSQKSALLHMSTHKFRLGEIVYGYIVNIKNYGIFIKIYKNLSLLHISEISSSYIKRKEMQAIFEIGQIIKVKVIHINMKQGRISVSTKNIDKLS